MKITIIIVAHNEEYALKKCLAAVTANSDFISEIICVDSSSSDSTLDIMKSYAHEYENIQVYRIEGDVNSAIARNVGIHNASGDILVFIDGDTELESSFLEVALRFLREGEADAVTGIIDDHIYAEGYERLREVKTNRHRLDEETVRNILYSGGNFIATLEAVKRAGLFDEIMYRNQDIDFTARIAKTSRFVSLPRRFGVHHTLKYNERVVTHLVNLYPMLFGRLLRKNADRPKVIFSLLKKSRDIAYGLFLAFLLLPVFIYFDLKYFMYFLLIVIAMDVTYGLLKKQLIVNRLIVHYLYPYLVLAGMFITFHNKPDFRIVRVL